MIPEELNMKMDSGVLYDPADPSLQILQRERLRMVHEYNAIDPRDISAREEMIKRMFASAGKDVYIEAPFYANWGGLKVCIGDSVYINFGCTLVDDAPITIGSHVMIGPGVTICTATHPLDYREREKGLQMNMPVVIEDNVWLCDRGRKRCDKGHSSLFTRIWCSCHCPEITGIEFISSLHKRGDVR